jgi:hypothetical protein
MLEAARRRVFDVLLVWRYDRFARSMRELVNALAEFEGLGIDFISYSEGADTTTPGLVRLAALRWLEPVASCDYAASSAASRQMPKASARNWRCVAAEIR